MNKRKKIDSRTFDFLQQNVLNITDLTRTNKLSEILNTFSAKESNEVYVVQNHKNKDATGVLVDMERYIKLLKLEEIFENTIDEHMNKVTEERKDDVADIPLRTVIEDDEDVDYEYIFNNFDKIDIED